METVEENLRLWATSQMNAIPLAGLLSRNPVVYKWKAPFRSWMLREAVSWRLHDLLSQSYLLHKQKHSLGARVLLRSGFETLAYLIHLNQLTQQVLDLKLDFHDYGAKTATLLLGSRNGSTAHSSINIVTILEKCDRKYPGIRRLYANLSESAHPNYEGLCTGYSEINHDEYETSFSNRWTDIYGSTHLNDMDTCIQIFHFEYNDVWIDLMDSLENWIEVNDASLSAEILEN